MKLSFSHIFSKIKKIVYVIVENSVWIYKSDIIFSSKDV